MTLQFKRILEILAYFIQKIIYWKAQIDLRKHQNIMIMQFKRILKMLIQMIIKVNQNDKQIKAHTLEKLNRYQEALQQYDYVIQKNPENADLYNNKEHDNYAFSKNSMLIYLSEFFSIDSKLINKDIK